MSKKRTRRSRIDFYSKLRNLVEEEGPGRACVVRCDAEHVFRTHGSDRDKLLLFAKINPAAAKDVYAAIRECNGNSDAKGGRQQSRSLRDFLALNGNVFSTGKE